MFSFLQKTNEKKVRLAYLALALATALVYDWLFWKQEIGLNYLVFVSLFAIVFTIIAYAVGQVRQKVAFFLLIPIFVLAFDVFFYRNSFVLGAVPIAETVLLFLYCVLLTLHNPEGHHFSFAQVPILKNIDLPFAKWATVYRDLFRWEGKGDKSTLYKHIAIGVVIAAPLLLVFTLLFAKADQIFAQTLQSFFHVTISAAMVWRIVRTLAITLLLSGLFYALSDTNYHLGQSIKSAIKFPQTVVATILTLINILFLGFVFIQITYLFGNAKFVFDAGITFADYARKGFFELAWVVVIAAVVLLTVYRSFAYHGSPWYVTVLQSLLVVQVALIAFSALKRMNLYQGEYGYTEMRLYVEWFIYFVLTLLGVSLVSLIAKIPFRRFFFASLIVGLTAFTMVASTNVDYVIAKQNVDRYLLQDKKLDAHYLMRLSVDSIPAVLPLLKSDAIAKLPPDQIYELWRIFDHLDRERAARDNWKEYHLGVTFTTRQWQGLDAMDWQNAKTEFKKAKGPYVDDSSSIYND